MSQGTPCYSQLDCVERLLAESQAREERLRDALKIIQLRPWHSQVRDRATIALEIPFDGTALKRAKQEVLLAAAHACENLPNRFRTEFDKVSVECAEMIRKMAKDLK